MTVVVTGASGKIGRQVALLLADRGVPHRCVSRRTTPPLDWFDHATWPAALNGVDRAFLILPGGDDGHRAISSLGERTQDLVRELEQAGVRHAVLVTALGMQYAPAEVDQRRLELCLQRSAMTWTIIRPNWFHQNVTEGPMRAIAESSDGVLRLPLGDAAISLVDTRDIAAVVVESLLDEQHRGREYDLTGPEPLTLHDLARISANSPIPVDSYEPVSTTEFDAIAHGMGWDPHYIDVLQGLFATIREGDPAETTDDVARVLGRPPLFFGEFVASVTVQP